MSDDFDIDIDFGNVQEQAVLETGDYICTISDVVVAPTKKGDGHNLVVTYEVDQPVEANGQKFKEWIYIYPENPFGVKQFAEAVLNMDLSEMTLSLRQIVSEVQDKQVGITGEAGTYNDRPSFSVTSHWVAGEKEAAVSTSMYTDGDEPL